MIHTCVPSMVSRGYETTAAIDPAVSEPPAQSGGRARHVSGKGLWSEARQFAWAAAHLAIAMHCVALRIIGWLARWGWLQ